uniref:Putative plant transposon protein domain-containing protein n=1 Tax=Solanum tuberosum TaxID=4113 RepID=M1DYQ5_SOLTU
MAPKAKNVVGSKRSRKRESSGSSSGREPVQKFGKKDVERYGWEWFECQREAKYMGNKFVNEVRLQLQFPDIYRTVNELGLRGKDVKFSARIMNELLGTPNCDPDMFNDLNDQPPYRDIRHTLCGVDSNARWEQSKENGRHNTLHFASFNQVARVWLKIVCSVLLPAKHLTESMMKFRNNMRWWFCYGELITHFLRSEGIEEETIDMTVAYYLDLTGKLVDVTRTKALDTSHGPVLSA